MSSLRITLNFYVLFLCFIAQLISTANTIEMPSTLKDQAKKIHDRCQKKTSVSEDLIHQGHEGNFPNDATLKCYLNCLFDTVGLIDADNVIHLEYLIDLLPTEAHSIVQNLADKCGTQPGSDGCDIVYQTLKCYFATDKLSLMAAFSFLFD